MSRDRAALSEGESVVRYRLEAGEVDWEIAPGRRVRGYGFNGEVPGPILEAKQGVPLEIEFTNRLPEPTVISLARPASRSTGADQPGSAESTLFSRFS